jgi:endonuclease/exonuclease/phosphatase family metal-dependent hydrolase
MAPERQTFRARLRFARLASIAVLMTAWVADAAALRVTTWNLAFYPGVSLSTRQPALRTIMADLDTDVIVLQELQSEAGRDSFLINVLRVVQPHRVWKATQYVSGAESAVFYDSLKVAILGTQVQAFATSGPRDVLRARVRPLGYAPSSNAAAFFLYSVHLKAGDAPGDQTIREFECSDIRNQLNIDASGPTKHLLVAGDYNVYTSSDSGYVKLLESQGNNAGRLKDPLNTPGSWHNNVGFAAIHTQSPCASPGSDCPSGFTGGAMDDRFDFILPTYNFEDGEGFDFIPGGYITYGNDGQHYNQAINGGGFNNAVGITIANALNDASDHLPIVYTLQLPAKLSTVAQLDFGSVIVGATAQQTLSVSNPANAPADELSYSLTPPADFTAPGGSFALNAGAPAAQHTLGMNTATSGARNGTLTIASDDPDSASKPVLLSGLVLDHAVASLDSNLVVIADTVDFGNHLSGQFTDQRVKVFNQGYDPLQARLSVQSGTITGGDGRFSILGGFSPALVAGTPALYTIHFDDTGATQDSTYEATLRFTSTDEALPGAAPAPDLVVTLRARPISGTTDTPDIDAPTALAFHAPRPNPFGQSVRFGFDLPRPAPVTLDVFDLAGRRVVSLVAGDLPPGRHQARWDARGEQGTRVPSGLYFARFTTPGMSRMARIVLLP